MIGQEMVLLPMPRRIEPGDGVCIYRPDRVAREMDARIGPQGYRLEIGDGRITIGSSDRAGACYAEQTLAQLRRQFGEALPRVRIEDGPDFPVRGIMLDISRDKVPTMRTLYELVDLFAEMKINQLQLYTEHTFAYSRHAEVWKDASPMTADEIRALDKYCADRFIELVPNQNSFGHMERWLNHARYKPLAECPDGFDTPWGFRREGGFTLNPIDPGSLALVEGLYDELLTNFSSKMFNVGCDETFDLGLGKSRPECEKRGKERVYLEFLLKIHHAVQSRGRLMQFWGDIILHKPELIGELPRDIIAINWGYDAAHDFEKETAAFKQAGVPFYVAPGTSSWCSIAGRTDNAMKNIRSAVSSGRANGAIGCLITDWGDYGHLQYLPISYPGFAAGAALAWCYETNDKVDLARALDLHVFRDAAGVMGKLILDCGNIYQSSKPVHNGSRVFWSLVADEDRKMLYEGVTWEQYDATEQAIAECLSPLDNSRMDRPDAQLVKDELRNNAAMLVAECQRGRWRLGEERRPVVELASHLRKTIKEHERLWVARNRPGGLHDSRSRLELPLKYYA